MFAQFLFPRGCGCVAVAAVGRWAMAADAAVAVVLCGCGCVAAAVCLCGCMAECVLLRDAVLTPCPLAPACVFLQPDWSSRLLARHCTVPH